MITLLEASAAQCRYQLGIALRIIADLDDSHLALEPMAWWRTRSCRTALRGPAGRPVGMGGWE